MKVREEKKEKRRRTRELFFLSASFVFTQETAKLYWRNNMMGKIGERGKPKIS